MTKTDASDITNLLVNGDVVQDTFHFGKLDIADAYFGAATKVVGFNLQYLAGLLGFGFQSPNSKNGRCSLLVDKLTTQ